MNKLFHKLNKLYPDKFNFKDLGEFNYIKDEEVVEAVEKPCYSLVDAWLVLIHTFGCMLTYYGNSPTSSDYSEALNVPVAVTGIILGVTPGLGFVSVFFFNWSSKKSYKPSYYISFIMIILGVFFYASAYNFNSIFSIILARCLFGFGAGRGLTKKFFAMEITLPYIGIYSSLLTGVSNACISLGPGLSSLFIFIPEFTFLYYEKKNYSIFTFVFFFLFIIMALVFLPIFKDIPSARKVKKKKGLKRKMSLLERKTSFIEHLDVSHDSMSFSSIESGEVQIEEHPEFKEYKQISGIEELKKFLEITEKEK